MERRVLVLGNSYIYRLNAFLNKSGLRLLPSEHNGVRIPVCVQGHPGASAREIWENELAIVAKLQPDIVFLQVGEHELNRSFHLQRVCEDIYYLATDVLHRCGAEQVIIGSLYPRAHYSPNTGGIGWGEYERYRCMVNSVIGSWFERHPRIHGFLDCRYASDDQYEENGLALSQLGNTCLLLNIREAVLHYGFGIEKTGDMPDDVLLFGLDL